MFWTRLASGIVLVAVAVVTIISGEISGLAWYPCCPLIGLIELYKTMGLEKTLLGYVGYGMTVIYSVMLHQSVSEAAAMAIVVMLFADQCGLCIYISEV